MTCVLARGVHFSEARGGRSYEKEIASIDAVGGRLALCGAARFSRNRNRRSGVLSASAACGEFTTTVSRPGLYLGGWILGQWRVDRRILGATLQPLCGSGILRTRSRRLSLA